MKTYFRIADAKNFKELQTLILSTKAAIEVGSPVLVGGFPNPAVSLSISKPADSKTKKWGKLYTTIGNDGMLPAKKIKEKHIGSSIPIYIAVDETQIEDINAQYLLNLKMM